MGDLGSAGQSGVNIVGQVLTWGGALAFLIGGLLLYPYVDSRLAPSPGTPIPLSSSPSPAPSSVSSARASSPTPTATVPTSTSVPSPTSPRMTDNSPGTRPTRTATPIPSPTPTPALPTRIVIPRIGVDGPVVPVQWQTVKINAQTQAEAWAVPAKYAAGWHETSAPLGASGNTVLNGHNTANGEIFRYLYTLRAGDVITVYSGRVPHTFAVTEILIIPEAGQPLEVRRENARYILPTEDERLTLVTCHPYGSLRNRLIVIAHPRNDERRTMDEKWLKWLIPNDR